LRLNSSRSRCQQLCAGVIRASGIRERATEAELQTTLLPQVRLKECYNRSNQTDITPPSPATTDVAPNDRHRRQLLFDGFSSINDIGGKAA
jgi:hypothetical protein